MAASVSAFSPNSNSKFRPSPTNIPFHPRLIFADSIKSSLRPYFVHSIRSNQRNPVAFKPHPRSRPTYGSFRPWIPRSKLSCFRCGKVGYLAKYCRFLARCYLCGDIGHKKSSCTSQLKEASASLNLADLGFGNDDDGWILHKELESEAELLIRRLLPNHITMFIPNILLFV